MQESSVKAWIVSPYDAAFLEERLKSAGIQLTDFHPDFIFTYGGDGTILQAEREFPNVPKIPIKKSELCSKCEVYDPKLIDIVLKKLVHKQYRLEEKEKVEAETGGEQLIGLNEIQIHNQLPYRALRFTIQNGQQQLGECIGDGLIAATAFGSAAYFKAVGGEEFTSGIMVALNNCIPRLTPFKLVDTLTVKITREAANLIADNREQMVTLRPGDTVTIRQAGEKARFVRF